MFMYNWNFCWELKSNLLPLLQQCAYLIVDGRLHGDGASQHVWVEVLAVHELDACRGVAVAVQQVVHVVLVAVSRQDDVA